MLQCGRQAGQGGMAWGSVPSEFLLGHCVRGTVKGVAEMSACVCGQMHVRVQRVCVSRESAHVTHTHSKLSTMGDRVTG